jgi:hypothetical protein
VIPGAGVLPLACCAAFPGFLARGRVRSPDVLLAREDGRGDADRDAAAAAAGVQVNGSAFGLESLPWLWVLVPGTFLTTLMAFGLLDIGLDRRGKSAGALALFWAAEGTLIALVAGYLSPAAAIPITVIALFANAGIIGSCPYEWQVPITTE